MSPRPQKWDGNRRLPSKTDCVCNTSFCRKNSRRGKSGDWQMIITRTPFRITLGGGGTDLKSYYEKHGGFIFAAGLDKYMFIDSNRSVADDLIRVKYTKSETVEHVDDLQHDLAREVFRYTGVVNNIEISSLAD